MMAIYIFVHMHIGRQTGSIQPWNRTSFGSWDP